MPQPPPGPHGPWVVVPVVFPILILLFPLIFRKRAVRMVATILIGGFVLVSGFSIGIFYLPAAVTMLLATCLTPPAEATDVSQ